LVAAIVSQVMAALFLVGVGYYVVGYNIDTGNYPRHEYLMGAWLLLLYSAGASLISALLAASIVSTIRKPLFQALVWPALALSSGVLTLVIVSVVTDLASRT